MEPLKHKLADVVYKIHKFALKSYTVHATKIQGVMFTETEGVKYICDVGGPTPQKDVFATFDEALIEAEVRWAMEKETSSLVGLGNDGAIVIPGSQFQGLIK